MGKGYIARGHRPTASGRSYELIYPKSTRLHGRSISAGSPGRVESCVKGAKSNPERVGWRINRVGGKDYFVWGSAVNIMK